jgi:hypothetical protein
MALPMVGSACGSSGDGIAGPPGPHDRILGLALQPVGLPDFRLGGAPDQNRLPVLAGVDPAHTGYSSPAPCGRRLTGECG